MWAAWQCQRAKLRSGLPSTVVLKNPSALSPYARLLPVAPADHGGKDGRGIADAQAVHDQAIRHERIACHHTALQDSSAAALAAHDLLRLPVTTTCIPRPGRHHTVRFLRKLTGNPGLAGANQPNIDAPHGDRTAVVQALGSWLSYVDEAPGCPPETGSPRRLDATLPHTGVKESCRGACPSWLCSWWRPCPRPGAGSPGRWGSPHP